MPPECCTQNEVTRKVLRSRKPRLCIGLALCPIVTGGWSIGRQEVLDMAKLAIWVMLKAKPGKEADVEAFLKQGAAMSRNEP